MVLSDWPRSALYWAGLIVLVLVMESIALFYQYRLDYWPCVLCIHVRIWLALLILIAIAALLLRNTKLIVVGHLGVALVGAGMTYTSWQLLGIERGFISGGTCGMGLGLPGWLSWLKLDQWLPWLFEVQTSCGYTPELLLGITMAEALMVFAILLLISSIVQVLLLVLQNQGE